MSRASLASAILQKHGHTSAPFASAFLAATAFLTASAFLPANAFLNYRERVAYCGRVSYCERVSSRQRVSYHERVSSCERVSSLSLQVGVARFFPSRFSAKKETINLIMAKKLDGRSPVFLRALAGIPYTSWDRVSSVRGVVPFFVSFSFFSFSAPFSVNAWSLRNLVPRAALLARDPGGTATASVRSFLRPRFLPRPRFFLGARFSP